MFVLSLTGIADYGLLNGTLKFDSDNLTRNITIDIVDDDIHEPNERFAIDLSLAEGPFVILSYMTTTITIIDNDREY